MKTGAHHRAIISIAALASALGAVGCGDGSSGKGADDTGTDADADTDSDTGTSADSDTDTDTDGDTDTDTNTESDTSPWSGPVESLGEFDLGFVTFLSPVVFPIPDNTLGFTIQVEGASAAAAVGIFGLRNPENDDIVVNFAMTGHDFPVFAGGQYAAAADPQSDSAAAMPVQPGDWELTIGSDGLSGGGAQVRIWARRTLDGVFHGGVLDINFFLVPGVTTAEYLDEIVVALFPFASIDAGVITTYETDSSYLSVDSETELRGMFASTSVSMEAPAVNLFVIGDLADSTFGSATAVTEGIPGSPMRHGTAQSGIAFVPSGDPSYDAALLLHEIGHFGGLFDTTALEFSETDPLSDTPSCPETTIASNPTACPDADNALFPLPYGATGLSAAQIQVLQGSALYRGTLE